MPDPTTLGDGRATRVKYQLDVPTAVARALADAENETPKPGDAMFAVLLGFGFTGFLLPWKQLSFFATKVGSSIAGSLPVIGHFAMRFMRGGDDVTGATLTRFFGFHVAVLPMLTTALLGLHLALIQRQGMPIPEGLEEEARTHKPIRFVPNFMMREGVVWLAGLAALAALAAFFPWELGTKADAFASAPAGIRPEWYFMYMFQTLKDLPAKIGPIDGEMVGILGFGLGGQHFFKELEQFLSRAAREHG